MQDAIARKMQSGCSILHASNFAHFSTQLEGAFSSLDMMHTCITGRLEAVAVGKCSKLSHGKDWKLVW